MQGGLPVGCARLRCREQGALCAARQPVAASAGARAKHAPHRAARRPPAAPGQRIAVNHPTNSSNQPLTVLLVGLQQLLVYCLPHERPRGGGSRLLRRLPLAAGQQAAWGDGPQQAACSNKGWEVCCVDPGDGLVMAHAGACTQELPVLKEEISLAPIPHPIRCTKQAAGWAAAARGPRQLPRPAGPACVPAACPAGS